MIPRDNRSERLANGFRDEWPLGESADEVRQRAALLCASADVLEELGLVNYARRARSVADDALRLLGLVHREDLGPEGRAMNGGALVLDDLAGFVRRFVVLTDTQRHTLALWIAHTHAIEAAETTPYLAITSARRSGKTRLLEVLELLVRAPLPTANISDAALFRVDRRPSRRCCSTRSTRSSGRRRATARICAGCSTPATAAAPSRVAWAAPRMTTLETFSVFCPKAFAGIGDAPRHGRRPLDPDPARAADPRRAVERFRRRDVAAEGEMLARPPCRLARAAARLPPRRARPALPDELDDRAQDVWEPLLAIADLAGGDWPTGHARPRSNSRPASEREDDSHDREAPRATSTTVF